MNRLTQKAAMLFWVAKYRQAHSKSCCAVLSGKVQIVPDTNRGETFANIIGKTYDIFDCRHFRQVKKWSSKSDHSQILGVLASSVTVPDCLVRLPIWPARFQGHPPQGNTYPSSSHNQICTISVHIEQQQSEKVEAQRYIEINAETLQLPIKQIHPLKE